MSQHQPTTKPFHGNMNFDKYRSMAQESDGPKNYDFFVHFQSSLRDQLQSPFGSGGEPTEDDLEKKASALRSRYRFLEDLDKDTEEIYNKLTLQEETFTMHEITLADILVNDYVERKISKVELNSWKAATESLKDRLRLGLLNILESVEKQLKQRRWWSRLVDFFHYILRTARWKRRQISLKLRKLRSNVRESRNVFSDEESAAINSLSFLDYKGFDFSDGEMSLIQKMAEDRSHLTSADRQSITQISQLQVAQIQQKLYTLKAYFSQVGREFPDGANLNILKAVQELEHQMKILKEWSGDQIKLFNTLKRIKEANEIPQCLDGNTQSILRKVLDESLLSDGNNFYMKAYARLGVEIPEFSEVEKRTAEVLNWWYDHHKSDLFASTLRFVMNLPKDQQEVAKRYASDYDDIMDSGTRLVKHAELLDTAKNFIINERATLEEPPSKMLVEYARKGLQTLRDMDVRLSEEENSLLHGFKLPGERSLTHKEINKLAMDGFILEEGELSTYLHTLAIMLYNATTDQQLHSLAAFDEGIIGTILRCIKTNEMKELERVVLMPKSDPEFQNETKLIKMLPILVRADYRRLEESEKLSHRCHKLLDRVAEIKQNNLRLARARYNMIEADMKAFKSIQTLRVIGGLPVTHIS
ncbi:hypothetical protein PCASD_13020 [Puccinia coronata f. sp. avenae]|uniref:Uncharacterized protein n=1 Tax=Puccinia coronata f. sp. avenae TaxID=200324 RepID=A0A2N5U6M7_9BASI|nr:hypothetical protein PCASD_13020 [Puccinia coronata f. sp. avenae]